MSDTSNMQVAEAPEALFRVLVIDDDPDMRAIIGEFLQSRGYEAYLAADGKTGLDLMGSLEPQLVLCDLRMPDMDGLEVLHEIKASQFAADVILITGYGSVDTALAAMKMGALDYVKKPFKLEELEFVIQRAKESRSLADKTVELDHFRELAQKDSLTGTYNRRFFFDRLDIEVDRAGRMKLPLALLMADIDNFKTYNDTLGHVFGDEVLRQVASTFEESVRKYDLLARYGGEEFAVIAPHANLHQAMIVGRRLCRNVRRHIFEDQPALPHKQLTVSVGMAVFPEHTVEKLQLVRLADEALYVAKSSGKNRLCVVGRGCEVP